MGVTKVERRKGQKVEVPWMEGPRSSSKVGERWNSGGSTEILDHCGAEEKIHNWKDGSCTQI